MDNISYILIDADTRQIRTDRERKSLLIFDTEKDAIQYLEKVKPKEDKDKTIIVARVLAFSSPTPPK